MLLSRHPRTVGLSAFFFPPRLSRLQRIFKVLQALCTDNPFEICFDKLRGDPSDIGIELGHESNCRRLSDEKELGTSRITDCLPP